MDIGCIGYKRGGGVRAKVGYCHNLQYETSFIGVSCLQLSLLTTDQNIVFPVPFIILVVCKDR